MENNKRTDIEFLRIFGAFTIVWYHTSVWRNQAILQSREIAYAGLPVFLILSLYLSCHSNRPKSVLTKAQRLLVPWSAWFLFYSLVNIAAKRPVLDTSNGYIAGILSGSCIHLWYLPYIFAIHVTIDFTKPYFNRNYIGYASAFLAIIMLASSPCWRVASLAIGPPIAQYTHASIGVLIGSFFGHYRRLDTIPRRILLSSLLLTEIVIALLPIRGVGVPYLVGTALTSFLLLDQKLPWSATVKLLSECTFGIYMIHPLFLTDLFNIHFPHPSIRPFFIFIFSLLVVIALRKGAPRMSRYII